MIPTNAESSSTLSTSRFSALSTRQHPRFKYIKINLEELKEGDIGKVFKDNIIEGKRLKKRPK